MSHLHDVHDLDSIFYIDTATRKTKTSVADNVILVQFDHNSERITFEMNRLVEGHDLYTCNRVEVHYINVENKTRESNCGVYEVTDLQVKPDDETKVVFSWLISQNATKMVGTLSFVIRFACVTDKIDYSWSTVIHEGIPVTTGIYNSDVVVEQYPDVLEQWYEKLFSTGDAGAVKSVNGIEPDENGNVDLGSLEADWNTLKNRPFFTRCGGSVIVAMQINPAFSEFSNGLYVWSSTGVKLVNGATYIVIWNNQEFTCTAVEATLGESAGVGLGNLSLVGLVGGNNEPFAFGYDPGTGGVLCYTTDSAVSSFLIAQDEKQDIIVDKEYVLSPSGNSVKCETSDFTIESGKTYGVVWDGVTYICDSRYGSTDPVIGDDLAMSSSPDAEMPFYIIAPDMVLFDKTRIYAVGTETATHTVSVYVIAENVYTIPEKYLPKQAINKMIDEYMEDALGGDY